MGVLIPLSMHKGRSPPRFGHLPTRLLLRLLNWLWLLSSTTELFPVVRDRHFLHLAKNPSPPLDCAARQTSGSIALPPFSSSRKPHCPSHAFPFHPLSRSPRSLLWLTAPLPHRPTRRFPPLSLPSGPIGSTVDYPHHHSLFPMTTAAPPHRSSATRHRARNRARLATITASLPRVSVQRLDSVAWDTGVSRAALLTYLLDHLPASGPDLQHAVRLACHAHGTQIPVRQADGSIRRDTRGRKR